MAKIAISGRIYVQWYIWSNEFILKDLIKLLFTSLDVGEVGICLDFVNTVIRSGL